MEVYDTESTSSLDENDDEKFVFGFYFYAVVTPTIDADLRFMDDKTRIMVEIGEFCVGTLEYTSLTDCKDCKFTSRTIPMELTNTPFNIRNVDSKFKEWCRVSV
jgi:hypothetical protein